jgi:hypothetical protein
MVEVALALGQGLGFRAGVDAPSAALLARLDGSRTLQEIFEDMAEATGVSLDEVIAPALAVVRMLLKLGFAVAPDGPFTWR